VLGSVPSNASGNSLVSGISDYGKLYASWDAHTVRTPQDATEVSSILKEARARGQAVRVRGSAHTFSGATIPREGDILLRTNALDHYAFDGLGTVHAGAGALAWDVRDLAARHGLVMPVYNGGWAGPTLGGYLCAGGMGLRVPPADRERWLQLPAENRPPLLSISETHGGFWEHVAEVTLVDGTGTVHHVREDDEVFPWLFANFGQFGVVTNLRLRLLPAPGPRTQDPGPLSGRVPRVQADDPAANDRLAGPRGDRILFWFSYLVARHQEEAAWEQLRGWVERHAPFLRPQGGWVGPVVHGEPIGYRYLVTFRRFHPPLLYPHAEDFVLMGLMATFEGVGTLGADNRILDLERDFVGLALGNGYRLYPQAENIGRGIDYAAYYGAATFATFQHLKRRFDPDGIINPGVVFPSATPGPQRTSLARVAQAALARMLGEDV
jgi:FAD/FMN-containing dehydrogenase